MKKHKNWQKRPKSNFQMPIEETSWITYTCQTFGSWGAYFDPLRKPFLPDVQGYWLYKRLNLCAIMKNFSFFQFLGNPKNMKILIFEISYKVY